MGAPLIRLSKVPRRRDPTVDHAPPFVSGTKIRPLVKTAENAESLVSSLTMLLGIGQITGLWNHQILVRLTLAFAVHRGFSRSLPCGFFLRYVRLLL